MPSPFAIQSGSRQRDARIPRRRRAGATAANRTCC
jgi:hypothetical protein